MLMSPVLLPVVFLAAVLGFCHVALCLAVDAAVPLPDAWLPFLNKIDMNRVRKTVETIAAIGDRHPASAGHMPAVQAFSNAFIQVPGIRLDFDSFEDETPFGQYRFHNIIATFGNPRGKRIIFAAHHDSKYMGNDVGFIGGTDSLLSCALLIEIAHVAAEFRSLFADVALQFVLFDGEEAFVQWEGTDHTYGSRHLAAHWNEDGNISNIQMFILLDLLGSKTSNTVFELHAKTSAEFSLLRRMESALRSQRPGSFKSKKPFLQTTKYHSIPIADDDEPFRQLGVPVLHMIPMPFPKVWHTIEDNVSAISWNNARSWAELFLSYTLHSWKVQGHRYGETLDHDPQPEKQDREL